MAEALATVASQVQYSQKSPVKIYVVPDHPVINSLTLSAFTEEKCYPYSFITVGKDLLNHQVMLSFDFVILKTGDHVVLFTNPNLQTALRIFPEVQGRFSLLPRLPLPDASELEIYVRKSPSLSIVPSPMKCLQTVPENYAVFVHIARSHDQKVVAWQDHALLGGSYPTYRWKSGEIFAESYQLELPDGAYDIMVGLFRPELSPFDPLYRPKITAAPAKITIGERQTRGSIGTVTVKGSPPTKEKGSR